MPLTVEIDSSIDSSHEKAIIRHVETGEYIAEIRHSDRIWCWAMSPNGLYVATASRDTSAKIWSASTNRVRTFLRMDGGPFIREGPIDATRYTDHIGYVWSVAFSPDSRFIATGGYDGAIRYFEVDRRLQIEKFQWLESGSVQNPPGIVVSFSSDGRTIEAKYEGQNYSWALPN